MIFLNKILMTINCFQYIQELKIMHNSSLSSNLWETVFKKKNLRFESYATGNSPK